MGKAVEVPGVVTLVAVTLGAALLGILGALFAIPIAAAHPAHPPGGRLPRLDTS